LGFLLWITPATASPAPQTQAPLQSPSSIDAEADDVEELEQEVGDRDPTYLRTRLVFSYDHKLLEGSASLDRLRLKLLYAFGGATTTAKLGWDFAGVLSSRIELTGAFYQAIDPHGSRRARQAVRAGHHAECAGPESDVVRRMGLVLRPYSRPVRADDEDRSQRASRQGSA
jgi:hypothetical protein